MLKYVLTALCAISIGGLGFEAARVFAADRSEIAKPGTVQSEEGIGCHSCLPPAESERPIVLATSTTAPATQKAPAVDVKNTKCIVTGEDVEDGTFEYKGKIYHVCCSSCEERFKKDPEKYIKDLEADPAKYGVPK